LSETVRHLEVLGELGVDIPKNARILDFGCGAGNTVRSLHSAGYANAEGYEVEFDGVCLLEKPEPYIKLGTQFDLRLPYPNNHFDLVISEEVFEHVQDQVAALRELQRVMKPGGHALHFFPARYRPREAHIYVPFGSVFIHRWYYKLWALLGVRNEFQNGLSANEIADRNAYFMVSGCRYVGNSCYRVIARKLGLRFAIVTQAYFDSHQSPKVRLIGKANRVFPLIGWLFAQLHLRALHLVKRADS
jgi:SAM-dependent methyltransferase